MEALKARVENGRYVIDEKADLPDGTELYLVPVGDQDEDREDIEEANRALTQAKVNGEKPIPWTEVKAELGL